MTNHNFDRYKSAFNNVSFDPEKRFNSFVGYHRASIKDLKEYAATKGFDSTRLEEKLYTLACNLLNSISGCASSVITGGSGFNVRRAEKRNAWRDKHEQKYYYYCENFKKIIDRATRVRLTQDEKKDSWVDKVAKLETYQETMKLANKALRKNDDEALKALGFTEQRIAELKKPDFCGRVGFANFTLTNNLANIKRLKSQVRVIDNVRRDNAAAEVTSKLCKIEHDNEELRWNLFFDGKPSEEIRNTIKRRGFKWSPSRSAWTRGSKTMRQAELQSILNSLEG